jgi:hypothetical protein
MFNKFTVSAVIASIVVTVGSTAIAAPRHAVRHQPITQQQIPANAYLSFGGALYWSGERARQYENGHIGLNESLGN